MHAAFIKIENNILNLYIYFYIYIYVFLSQAIVSLKRLGKFLCQEELQADSVVREPFKSGE